MASNEVKLEFFFRLAKAQSIMSRKFDGRLGGLGFNEFIILSILSRAQDGRIRRVDLADRIGLTPSGVTRLLLPMEKIGLVKRESDELDGRVSFVALAAGGMRKLEEALERADVFMDELNMPSDRKLEELSKALSGLGIL